MIMLTKHHRTSISKRASALSEKTRRITMFFDANNELHSRSHGQYNSKKEEFTTLGEFLFFRIEPS